MAVLYNIAIYFYQQIIRLVSLFDAKAKLWVKGRRNWETDLEKGIDQGRPVYWFHAASLGEFEQGRPLIEKIKKEQKDVFILLTFFSPSGYEVQKDYKGADYICYLPADTKSNAKTFIDIVNPKQVFFIKYEFWFNYMQQLQKREIPLHLISGIFHHKQIFFKPYGSWFKKQLKAFTYFFVQDSASVEKLKALGFENTFVAGDTRFDRVIEIAEKSDLIPVLSDFTKTKPCLVIGSSWPEDEIYLTEYINLHPEYHYVIAPHEIKEDHLQSIESQIKLNTQRWTSLGQGINPDTQVILVDTIGMLSKMYRYADLTYVGGAFKTGLHNVLEAAVYGKPVIFGPHYSKFQEASALISEKGGFSINSKETLFHTLDRIFTDKMERELLGENAKAFIYKSQGAAIYIHQKLALLK